MQYDIAVVGGGVVGASIAFGLTGAGRKTVLLDEGDQAIRASRANFALIWVQSKGLSNQEYLRWTLRSARQWRVFADEVTAESGIALSLEQRGGFAIALSDKEMNRRSSAMLKVADRSPDDFRFELLGHNETRAMLPGIGPDVVGSIFSPHDGHVNALALFYALHLGLERRGGSYLPNSKVSHIVPVAGGFRLETARGPIEAERIVLAAGLQNRELAPLVGLSAPVEGQRGQIIVTERLKPFIDYPINGLRQNDAGSVLIGNSQEDDVAGITVQTGINAAMADRAVRTYPRLAQANVVRTWSGLRIKSPDTAPIYDESAAHRGAFVVNCHSGVTLAAVHASDIADWILGEKPELNLAAFSARRFRRAAPAVSGRE